MAYAPAGNLTTDAAIKHLATVLYKKVALDRLLPVYVFRDACWEDALPLRSGKTAQWFRYTNLTASTSTTSEGTVGTSLNFGSNTISATISQYANFITLSDLLDETAIDPIMTNASELLGDMAGNVVDLVTRAIADGEYASVTQSLIGSYLAGKDLKAARHVLQGNNVPPMDDGLNFVVAHPYVTYDLMTDSSAAGVLDTWKYTNADKTGAVRSPHRGELTVIGTARVVESTNCKYTDATPDTWDVYIFGYRALGFIPLAGRGPSKVTDPKRETFTINRFIGGPDNVSIANPEGKIAGGASYNFKFAVVVLDGASATGTYRFRIIRAPSSIVS